VFLSLVVVLLLRKDYVVGLIVAVLVGLRILLLVPSPVRRTQRRSTGTGQSGRNVVYPGRLITRQVLRPMAKDEFKIAAEMIGIDAVSVRREFGAGQSIAVMADERGVRLDQVINAVLSDVMTRIDNEVSAGRLSQEQGSLVKARAPDWVNRFVNIRRQELDRFKS
jgi:hypothetical protein